jgi:SAM-dependent methyltransferase
VNKVEQQRAHFESVSARYFQARQTENHLTLKHLLWRAFLQDKTGLFAPVVSVLEPMCGYSEGRKILRAHLASDIRYSGFDYSQSLVEEARSMYPTERIDCQDITQWTPDEEHDLVIVIGGLHHVPHHTERVLRSIHDALKPGGHFINFEPTQNNALLRWIRQVIYRRNPLFDEQTERAFDLPELNRLYRSAGFEPVDQMYPGLLSYVLYYNPDAFPALNLGSPATVERLFRAESRFYRGFTARKLSFATMTLLVKPEQAAGNGKAHPAAATQS